MEETSLHRELEIRLTALATRIAELRHKMSRAKGAEKIEEFGEITELEKRHATLAGRLQDLHQEGTGFRHEMKVELERLTDDLSGAVENFVLWADSGSKFGGGPTRPRKP